MKEDNFCVIVSSCDKYVHLLNGFFHLFNKYWPEYQGDIFLNLENNRFYEVNNRVHNVIGGNEKSWSQRLADTIKLTETDYVLLFLDDFYLKGKVNHQLFLETLHQMNSDSSIKSITYLNEPGGNRKASFSDDFLQRKHFSLYKVTMHISLWRKDELLKLLRNNENAWETEVKGTIRSWARRGKYLCTTKDAKPIFPYDYGLLVVKGSYYTPTKEYFENVEHIRFDDSIKDTNEIPVGKGSLYKKFIYLFSGLLSIFNKK